MTHREQVSTGAPRGHVLIVEPDPLTQWSLKTYLGKWFSVESTDSIAAAQRVLDAQPVHALVASGELPPTALASLEERARELNARVAVVRTVTDPGKLGSLGPQVGRLEKPFELAELARLLGIPASELPGEP